jgi:hypothetical protein
MEVKFVPYFMVNWVEHALECFVVSSINLLIEHLFLHGPDHFFRNFVFNSRFSFFFTANLGKFSERVDSHEGRSVISNIGPAEAVLLTVAVS